MWMPFMIYHISGTPEWASAIPVYTFGLRGSESRWQVRVSHSPSIYPAYISPFGRTFSNENTEPTVDFFELYTRRTGVRRIPMKKGSLRACAWISATLHDYCMMTSEERPTGATIRLNMVHSQARTGAQSTSCTSSNPYHHVQKSFAEDYAP